MLKEHLQKTYDLKISNTERMPKVLENLASKLTAENISQAMYELNRNKGNSYLSTMDEVVLLRHFTKLVEENTPIQGQMEFKLDGKEVIYDIKSEANTATEGIYGREKEHRVCEDRRLLLSDSQGKTKQESKEKPDSKAKEGASCKVRSCATDREREIRQAVASTVMLPLLPTPKQQQELIQKSIETAITSKPPTSLHKRLNDKQIEANIINSKRVVKSAMKRQKGMGL